MADENTTELTAGLENTIIESILTLQEMYDYSEADIERIVKDALTQR